MTFSNLAKQKILNGRDTHGSGPDTSPMGDGYIFLKYAWSIKISDTGLDSAPPLVAKTCELPRWSVETQMVNVYNHKTIVQTKLNYEPISMSFYDQVNGSAERLLWNYVKGQFDDTDGSKTPNFAPLTIEITMKDLSGDSVGDKVYTLTDAYITDAQHDTLDYSTSDVVLWTITVRYEDLKIDGVKDLEFKGPTPVANTGIAALPKPPKPPKPITKPPKADALKEIERGGRSSEFAKTDPRRLDLSNWEKAGGGVTAGGAAFGNPSLTKQAARARASAQKSPTTTAWPAAKTGVSDTAYDAKGNVTGYTASAGSATPATTNKQRELTPKQTSFIAQETADVKSDTGMNPEYKKAYLEGLKKYPPRTDTYQSKESARDMAEMEALRVAPRYASQTRTVDNGVITDRANLSKREPAPASLRDGTNIVNQPSTDSKGTQIANTQEARQRTFNANARKNQDKGNF